MKKIVSFLLILAIIISFNINSYAVKKKGNPSLNDINGITIDSSIGFNIKDIKSHGFKTIFLNADSIRKAKKPYNTNYKSLKLLQNDIKEIEKANMDYVICFTSGPGFSSNGKIKTLFSNKYEMICFSKMVKELAARYHSHKNFKAISISIESPDIAAEKYYQTQNYIINSVSKSYNDLQFIYNLHPLSYEEGFKSLPYISQNNIVLNTSMNLKGLSYPGYGAGYKTSYKLNKNSILDNLEAFKEYQNKYKLPKLITLKTPWVKNSDVLLQDLFEVLKILGFDYNISYGNSHDMYDLSSNKSALNVIDRHNK